MRGEEEKTYCQRPILGDVSSTHDGTGSGGL